MISEQVSKQCFLPNIDYIGGTNVDIVQKDSVSDCQLLCQQTSGCKAFTYITNSYNGEHGEGARGKCHLKSVNNGPRVRVEGLVSGPKFCPGKVLWFNCDIQFFVLRSISLYSTWKIINTFSIYSSLEGNPSISLTIYWKSTFFYS